MSRTKLRYSDDLKHRHRARVPHDETLGSQLAIVAISRGLRSMLQRATRFVATVVIPPNANTFSYSCAARVLLDGGREYREDASFEVLVVKDDADATPGKIAYLDNAARGIILLESQDLLSDAVRLASDVVITLDPPSARDIAIAARRMGFGRIKSQDAEFLATQDVSRLSLMMRRGRSVETMIGRLRNCPVSLSEPAQTTTQIDGPSLHDLAGYGPAKVWGLELAQDLADWKDGRLPWNAVDRGLLISGPPGCGKTQFAKALAKTCGVELVAGSAASWQARGHLGDMLKAMKAAFAEAAAKAPAILFIDEFDAFERREESTEHHASYSRQVVNGLLEAMDGTQGREGVVVVGATNFPGLVDEALRRPGRLERHCVIPLPDKASRTAIFRYHLEQDLGASPLEAVVSRTEGWSGADIERCVRDARRLARRARRAMEFSDLVEAMPERTVVPADTLRSVAVHEVGHGIVGSLLEADELVSIEIEDSIATTSVFASLGGASFNERPISRKTSTYFENKIAIYLAGMAAERVVFGDHSTAASGNKEADLNIATDLATMMEVAWGFGKSLVTEVCISSSRLQELRAKRPGLIQVVESTLQKQMNRATALLEERREVIDYLAERLLEHRRLDATEVMHAIREHQQRSSTPKARAG